MSGHSKIAPVVLHVMQTVVAPVAVGLRLFSRYGKDERRPAEKDDEKEDELPDQLRPHKASLSFNPLRSIAFFP